MEALMSFVLTGTGIILLTLSAVTVVIQQRGPANPEPQTAAAPEPPTCPTCGRRARRMDAQFCARCRTALSSGAPTESAV